MPIINSFGNSYSCITAVEWDAYDVENTAGNARRCRIHSNNSSRFHPGNRAEVFIWQNFQPGSYEEALSEKKQRWRKGQTAGRDDMACGRLL